jgi:hypothetical protein
MAAGKACIVSDWAALGEWPGESSIRVFCSTVAVNQCNVYGGVMDRELAVGALGILYRDEAYRKDLEQRALRLAQEDRFNWTTIGRQFADVLDQVLYEPRETFASTLPSDGHQPPA